MRSNALQHRLEFFSGALREAASPVGIEIFAKSAFEGRCDVGYCQLRMELAGEIRSPFQGLLTLWAEIHGAENSSEAARIVGRRVRNVNPGEDGTIRVMQNLGGDRAQDEAPKRTVSMGGDYNEAGALGMRELDDLAGRVSCEHDTPDIHVSELTGQEVVQEPFRPTPLLCVESSTDRTGEFVSSQFISVRAEHVKKRELRMKVARQPSGVPRSSRRSLGEINW